MPTELLQPVRRPPQLGDGGPFSGGSADSGEDDVDPELLALPPPPKAERQRTLALLVLLAITALAMAYALRGEASYALRSAVETDVGDLYAVDATKLEDNTYLRAHGALGAALAVRFERPFEADTYRVSPVMGRRDLWVEVRVPAGSEGARYVPPSSFRGRIVRWSASGIRHRGLEGAVDAVNGEAIPEGARLLVDGESPASARWALGLAITFLGFAVWSVVMLVRLVRPVSE